MSISGTLMARNKVAPSKAKTDATPAAPLRQKNVLALKGTDAWKAWLDAFAEGEGMPVTVLVDRALREKAKRDGYGDPPTRV